MSLRVPPSAATNRLSTSWVETSPLSIWETRDRYAHPDRDLLLGHADAPGPIRYAKGTSKVVFGDFISATEQEDESLFRGPNRLTP
jgi:hypothetical protein